MANQTTLRIHPETNKRNCEEDDLDVARNRLPQANN